MKILIILMILIILLVTVFLCFFIKAKKKIVNTLKTDEKDIILRNNLSSKSYFMQTLRHYPCSISDFGLKKCDDGTYYREEDQSYWISKSLYDLGYGREKGFCKLPLLSFEELIALAFDDNVNNSDIVCVMNHWGAISVLTDDYYEKTNEYINLMMTVDMNFRKKYDEVIEYIITKGE